jgi:CheY-like chemotaxis protein
MNTNSFRVVYAEDDDLVRATIARMLVERGLNVHECSNGGEAVLLCTAFRPDVALLDLTMPGIDGFEAARRIREHSPKNIRIIALTGSNERDARGHAALAGFDDFLCKPISAAALLGALQDRAAS